MADTSNKKPYYSAIKHISVTLGALFTFLILGISFLSKLNYSILLKKLGEFVDFFIGSIFPKLVAEGDFITARASEILLILILYGGLAFFVFLSLKLSKGEFKESGKVKPFSTNDLSRSLISVIFVMVIGIIAGIIKILAGDKTPTQEALFNYLIGVCSALVLMIGSSLYCFLWGKYPKIINKEIVLYIIFGGLTTLVNIVTFVFFRSRIGENLFLSNAIAWFFSVAFAYVVNKVFVFQSKVHGAKENLREVALFVGARVFSLGVDMAGMWLLVSVMNINDSVAKLSVNVLVMIMNYIFSKLWIFRKEEIKESEGHIGRS